jgi:hypothetical protein
VLNPLVEIDFLVRVWHGLPVIAGNMLEDLLRGRGGAFVTAAERAFDTIQFGVELEVELDR